MQRRKFLTVLAGLIAAPAIVRAGNIMRIAPLLVPLDLISGVRANPGGLVTLRDGRKWMRIEDGVYYGLSPDGLRLDWTASRYVARDGPSGYDVVAFKRMSWREMNRYRGKLDHVGT